MVLMREVLHRGLGRPACMLDFDDRLLLLGAERRACVNGRRRLDTYNKQQYQQCGARACSGDLM